MLPLRIVDAGFDPERIYPLFSHLKELARSQGTKLSDSDQQTLAIARILSPARGWYWMSQPRG
jgi:ABC-type branched-subunit amino acid transport system ATPase component